jgi:hypothetical protein
MHYFVSCLMHCVFATKEGRPLIKPDLQSRLWPYLGGIARENRIKALVVGGVEDHVHAFSVPQDRPFGQVWKGFTHFGEGDVPPELLAVG